MIYSESDKKRFWNFVDADGICWEWQGGKSNSRKFKYGHFWAGGKTHSAHRVSWEILMGEIPKGKELDHICRNPSCVNPDHLRVVTHQENNDFGYGITAMNKRKGKCLKGHLLLGKNLKMIGNRRACKKCAEPYWKRNNLMNQINRAIKRIDKMIIRDKIRGLRNSGMKYEQISDSLKVSKSVIDHAIHYHSKENHCFWEVLP